MARKKGKNNKGKQVKRKCIYFFLEGSKECSEHLYISNYYNKFKDKAIDIKFSFIPCGSGDWKNIEKNIRKEIKNRKNENYEIWCVIDKDQNNLDFIQNNCIKNDYKLIFSNYSFEVWLLYHLKDIKIRECSKKNYQSLLSKKIGKEYKKSSGIEFKENQRKIAIEKSKKVHVGYIKEEKMLNECYNCTNFYEIIEKIDISFKNFEIK